MQRALIQYRDPKNYDLVTEALIKANRRDSLAQAKTAFCAPPRRYPFCSPKPAANSNKPFDGKTKRAKHGRTSQPPAPQSRRWTGEPPKKRGKR